MKKLLPNVIAIMMVVCASTAFAQEYQDESQQDSFESVVQYADFTSDGLNFHISSTSPPEVLLMGESIVFYPYGYELRVAWYPYEDKWPGNLYRGDVVIPPTVEHDGVKYDVVGISYGTFTKCTGLTSISIPPTVRSIRPGAFFGCTALKEVKLPDGVALADDAFAGCSALKSIDLTYIGSLISSRRHGYNSLCTEGCSALEEIYLPLSEVKSVTGIIMWRLDIPDCKIHAPWLNPPYIEPMVVDKTPQEDAVLYVPEGSAGKYAAEYPWNLFNKIVEEPARPGADVQIPRPTERKTTGKRVTGADDRGKSHRPSTTKNHHRPPSQWPPASCPTSSRSPSSSCPP